VHCFWFVFWLVVCGLWLKVSVGCVSFGVEDSGLGIEG